MQKKIKRRNTQDNNVFEKKLHPLLQRIYTMRGIKSAAELELNLERLLPYQNLLGIKQAVLCLAERIAKQEKILIVGDFDADGATSSAVAIRALVSFGAKAVEYLVPNRFAFGYGLTPELVEVAKKLHPALIVTVDNGIANHEGVLAAKEAGIKVIITDHHLPSETLPIADAIVNPNQAEDLFSSKNMAGVGVIFYVMLALRRYLTEQNWFAEHNIPEPNMSKLLDLVALGTVADVVSLDHNNRIMVYQGLRRIRAGQCIPGITALLEIAGRNPARLVASDLGFAVAPRLNDERRVIEQEMQHQAYQALLTLPSQQSTLLPSGICLFDETWHQGVIGILAARIKDKFHRPVIAFARVSNQELKGSGRSVQGFHIRDALARIASHSPHLITKFGGHAMAAGLTITPAFFEEFKNIFDKIVAEQLSEDDLNASLLSDGELSAHELTLEIAEVLREAGPWGQSFPEPLFDGKFDVIDQRLVGGKHLKMVLAKENHTLDAIAFNVDLNNWPNYRCQQINVAYRIDVNEFRGKRSVQLIVEHLELV
jgi:single-stranded-DNA-specific exonuclease